MAVYIGNDELIVGNQASKVRAAPVFPEYSWDWIIDELNTFDKREADAFEVPDETSRILKHTLKWWEGKSLKDRALNTLPKEVIQAQQSLVFILTSMSCGTGHLAPNYSKVIQRGLSDVKREACENLENLDLSVPHAIQKADFYKAAIEVCEAACRFANRYATIAEKLAESEKNTNRAAELLEIARICRKVPYQPASSFQEAVQSFWFIHLIIQIEANGHSISPGRFDQYLYKFYQKDLENRLLSKEQAFEILGCLWIKFNEIMKLRDRIGSKAFGGYPLFQNLIVGGLSTKGADATNPLSLLCIEVTKQLGLPQPSLSVRVHQNSPQDFLHAAGDLAKKGFGMPAFFNDDAIIPILERMGVPLHEARDYAEVGCVEPQSPGKTNGYYPTGFLNLGKVLNLTLAEGGSSDSYQSASDKASTSNGNGFVSEATVRAAFEKQVDQYARLMAIGVNVLDTIHGQLCPNPFVSLTVDDCMEKGLSYEEGGATYNYTSPNVVGLANAADALMAIRRAVFTDEIVDMETLLNALVVDFKGYEELQQILLNRIPKYGNDDLEVDQIARELSTYVLKAFKQFRNVRGGSFEPGLQSISAHALFQDAVGATPDGRTSKMLLADGGISPAQGRDRNGPTATIRSAARLDQSEASNGALLNIKLHPEAVSGEKGTDALVSLVETYFNLGGQHIQFNVVGADVLRDAQENPDNYRNLVVRVAGFSVFFTAIDNVLQNDIIERTEHIFQ
jgi:formate C-acetyltransferase